MPNAELNIVARMTDLASGQLQRLRGEVWMLSRVTDQSLGTVTRYDKALSGLMVGGMLTAFSRGIFSMVEANNELDRALIRTRNNTTMAIDEFDRGAVSLEQYRDTVMRISTDTGAGAEQVAEGFQHAFNYANDMTVAVAETTMATKSARANYADLEKTVDLLSSVMHQFGYDELPKGTSETEKLSIATERAAKTMGILDRAAAMGNMTVEEFVNAAGRSYAAAAKAGIGIEEASAAYVALTKRGFNAAQAQTQLTNIITKMQNPTKEQAKYIKELSKATGVDLVHAFSAVGIEQNGLLGTIDLIRTAYQKLGYGTAQATQMAYKLINAQRGGQGLAVLITNGYEDMTEALGVLKNEQLMAATTESQFAEASRELVFNLETLKTIVNNVTNQIAEGMKPALNAVVKAVTPIVSAIYNFVTENKSLAGAVALVLGVLSGLLGVLMTVGATAILLGPIFRAGGLALRAMSGETDQASTSMGRQIAATQALVAAQARMTAVSRLAAASEATRASAVRLGVEAMVAARTSVGGLGASYTTLQRTLGSVSAAVRLKAKEVKGLTQAEVDAAAATKLNQAAHAAATQSSNLESAAIRQLSFQVGAATDAARTSAAAQLDLAKAQDAADVAAHAAEASQAASIRAFGLQTAALESNQLAIRNETDALRTLAAAESENTRSTALGELAAKGGAKAAFYQAEANKALDRSLSLGIIGLREKAVTADLAAAAMEVEAAQTEAAAAAAALYAAQTDTLLTIDERRVAIQNAIARQTAARVQVEEALTALDGARTKATNAVTLAETELGGALKNSTLGIAAYGRAQAALNSLNAMASSLEKTRIGLMRDRAASEAALTGSMASATKFASLQNIATAESAVAARATTAAKKLQAAQEIANAAATNLATAATDKSLSADQRRILLDRALADQQKARAAASKAVIAVEAALAKATKAAAVAEAEMKGALAGTTEGVAAYNRAQARIIELRQLAAGAEKILVALERDEAATMEALAAVTAETKAAMASFTISLKGVQIATIQVSQGVYALYRAFMITQAVLRTVVGALVGFAKTLVTVYMTSLRTASALVRAFYSLAEAAVTVSRWVGNAAKAVWTFVTASRAGARAAETQALAMDGLAGSSMLVGDSLATSATRSKGLLGFLGGLVGKLFGLGLAAMIVYDMWESNFLGLKDLTTRIFGGYLSDAQALVSGNNQIADSSKKAAAALTKIPANAGPAGTVINKLGQKIVTSYEQVNGVWQRTISVFDKGGKLVSRSVESVTETVNKDGSKVRTYVADMGDSWKTTTDTFDKNGKKISTTFKTVKKDAADSSSDMEKALVKVRGVIADVAGYLGARFNELVGTLGRVRDWIGKLFEGGTWATIGRFARTLESVFGSETAKTFVKIVFKVKDALDALFGGTGPLAEKFARIWETLGTAINALFSGDLLTSTLAFYNVVKDIFGEDFAGKFLDTLVKVQNVVTKVFGVVRRVVEKFSKALGKLLDTGDLVQFFRDLMPTEAEWAAIWKWVSDTAASALRTAFDLKNAIGGVLDSVWKWLFGDWKTDEQGVTYWAAGILGLAWEKLKAEWEVNIRPKVEGLTSTVWAWLFGGPARDDKGNETGEWAPGIFEKAWNALKNEWDLNIAPKLSQIVSNVWANLFGGAIKDDKGNTVTWANGIISEAYSKLKDKWDKDWGPKVRGILDSVWIWLCGGNVPDPNAGVTTWTDGVVQKLWAALGGAFERVKPVAIDIWGALFGKKKTEQTNASGDVSEYYEEGIVSKFIAELDKELGKLAVEIEKNQTIKDDLTKAGYALGSVVRGVVGTLFADGESQSGFAALGHSLARNVIGPILAGLVEGILGLPPNPDLGNSINTWFNKSLAWWYMTSPGGRGFFGEGVKAANRAAAEALIGPEALKALELEIARADLGKVAQAYTTKIETVFDTSGKAIGWRVVKVFADGTIEAGKTYMTDAGAKLVEDIGDGASRTNKPITIAVDNSMQGAWTKATAVATSAGNDIGNTLVKTTASSIDTNMGTVSQEVVDNLEIIRKDAEIAAANAGEGTGRNFAVATASAIDDNAGAVGTSATSMVETTVTTANTMATKMSPMIGKTIDVETARGIDSNVTTVKEKAENAIARSKDAANTKAEVFNDVGVTVAVKTANGIASKQQTVNNAATSMVDNATAAANRNAYGDGLTIGQRIAAGLAAGLSLANARLDALAAHIDQLNRKKLSDPGRGFAAGGRVDESGIFKVGERGPEYVRLPAGALVRNATQARADDRGNAGQGTVYQFNLTQNVQGPVPSPIQGFQALQAWARC